MVPFPVSLHIGRVHAHKIALVALHRLGRVRLFHVSIEHKLLGIVLVAIGALEWPKNTVRYPEVRDQPSDEVELLLAQFAGLLVTFESVTIQNSRGFRGWPFL